MIDELETNKLVGVLVLGKTFHHRLKAVGGLGETLYMECFLCGMKEEETKSNLICEPYIPSYTTDISACGEVLEWILTNSNNTNISSRGNLGYTMLVEYPGGCVISKEITVPMTICRGALELRKKI